MRRRTSIGNVGIGVSIVAAGVFIAALGAGAEQSLPEKVQTALETGWHSELREKS
jgi:hypothetical protein